MSKYILAVDQSTQGTKGLLFDKAGHLVARADRPHRQIITDQDWVEHDPAEIMRNVYGVCADVIEKAGINAGEILAMGLSNQRETTVAWNKQTGEPICNAVVWQCARAAAQCEQHRSAADLIFARTGLTLSPYFPAAKMQWIMENVPAAAELASRDALAFGTIDSWVLWNLGEEHPHKTDYSNASRTQLFHITNLKWDEELCGMFKVPLSALPEVCMSDSIFTSTDLGGLLPAKIPVCGVLGDSHGALFGQNCRKPGQMKATYGTGSSVMLNIGETPVFSESGLVTSLAWGQNGKVSYVLEGNLNYTGAVITWLKDQVGLIENAGDTARMAAEANPEDRAYFVPAFTGLGSPYWDSAATGLLTGVTRTTGKNEIVKACVECIAYQITDLLQRMQQDFGRGLECPQADGPSPECPQADASSPACRSTGDGSDTAAKNTRSAAEIVCLRVDGGPSANAYLMQFQSDMADLEVHIPELQELSGMGAAYMAGISAGLYDPEHIYDHIQYTCHKPQMPAEMREKRYAGWKQAIRQVLTHGE